MASIARGRSRRREGDGSSERNAARSTVPSPDHQGVVSSRKQATYPGILPDSVLTNELLCPLSLSLTLFPSQFAAVNRQSKSRKTSVVPMKMLIDEEFSNDVNARHISPGAVGRLMGLDSLPSSGTHNQRRYTQSYVPKTSSDGFHDRNGLHEGIPHRRSADDIIDVFEVMEATKTKTHRSPRSKNGNTSSRFDKVDSADIDFIQQKFIDAKRLSTDESLHMSQEFNETLDTLVSNRDVLLEFLQKFDPVVRRDLHNRGSPSSTANCITILKPSRRNQVTGTESNFNEEKEVKNSLRKPYSNLSSQSRKEESGSLRQKLSRSSHQENTGKRGCPTRIVVLKPSLEKSHDIEGALPLHHEIPHSGYRKHKEYQDAGRWSPDTEDYMCQVPLGDSETLGRMGKGSREIAREITKQMRAARGGSRKHVKLETITFASDERPLSLPSVTKLKTPEAIHRSSETCDAWASSSINSSPTYSTETSVSKEAKKHLSNRWKKTHQFQDQVTDSDGCSTLGDVLALSDQDASKVATHKMACRKCPKGEVQSDRMQGSCIYPLSISSNDGWRDTATSKLTRSKSLPSSFIRGVQKSNNRKRAGSVRYNEFSMLKDVLKVGPHDSEYACRGRQRQSLGRDSTIHGDESDPMFPDNEERMVVEREIHVNYEEPVNSATVPDTSEHLLHPANIDHGPDAVGVPDTGSAILGSNRTPLSSAGQNQQMLKHTATALDGCLLDPNLDDMVTKDERIEYHDDSPAVYDPRIGSDSPVGTDHHQGDDNQTLCIPPDGSESPTSSNKDDQQSPVSVLESSMDAEDVYSGDFEKISADLQGKMQLRLLKRETTDRGDDTELFILSDDETACQPFPEMEESQAFRDEEERDFSYVLDMLTGLGIHTANQDELLENCYLLECPACPDLYDELENKYSSLILWPPAERKLLFNITSAVLGDIITSLMQSCSKGLLRMCSPGWDQDEFAEMVWQRVVQLRQEMEFNQESLLLSVEWAGSEDGAYLVGSDIGSILQEDLLEEIVADFLRVAKSAKLCG
ncbi:hypothetical protein BAE44_0026144 [Dichanthelium oligosanthes]|uniref:DUF4378 domain-containing protein n=1 Tax=Dichanthelium oligosanthes TaxID=888268 RepID=A0A1E5UIY1_9POAL|nr:hypothetical protein BAE44_0026144 [Dichanthelium oligosanthes]